MKKLCLYSLVCSLLTFAASLHAETKKPDGYQFETKDFRLRLNPRTPNQIAAFYEGRGFPKAAIDELRNVCFVTILLKNKGEEIVWFDLSNWQITNAKGPVKRYLRAEWKQRWQAMDLAKRFQSTFRWTLMPEQLDFRAYEGEGGNITLQRDRLPMTVTGTIYIGKEKQIRQDFKLENIECAYDQ